jgi:hypothetical protein
MTTPLIPPPPAPPKKRTVNARLEESIFEDLKRYIVYAGGGDFSHVINKGLSMVFENDTGFRPWVAAHPGTISEPRKKKPQPKPQQSPKTPAHKDTSLDSPTRMIRPESESPTGGAHAGAAS